MKGLFVIIAAATIPCSALQETEILSVQRITIMVRQQKQGFNQREKKAFTRILLLTFFLSVFLLSFFPSCSFYSYYQMQGQQYEIIRKNKTLSQESADLNKEINLLLHDEKYLEKIARKKYGMLKKDEEVYYLSPKK